MTEFTKEQLDTVRLFLGQVRDRAGWQPEEMLSFAHIWGSGLKSWSTVYGIGAADTQMALWWYQYRRKPGSKEWRPPHILRALIQASERDYIKPELLPISTSALRSTNNDRKQARRAFIKRHGVTTFYHEVKPILRRGGVEALFMTPATPETREYVAILAGVASGDL